MPIEALGRGHRWNGRARRQEAGAEELEFAIVVVLLLTLMLGIFWFARGYDVHATMTRAAREGARVAAMPSSFAAGNAYLDPANVTNPSGSAIFTGYIAPVLQSSNLDPSRVTNYSEQITWLNPSDPNPQCGVIVSFQYPFTLAIPFSSLRLTTLQLSVNVQMRRETQSSAGTCP
jgi:Flp pilus assembly protein TadG